MKMHGDIFAEFILRLELTMIAMQLTWFIRHFINKRKNKDK